MDPSQDFVTFLAIARVLKMSGAADIIFSGRTKRMTMDVIVASLPPKSFVICWMPNSFFLAEPCLHSSPLCIRKSDGPQDLTNVRKVQLLGNIAVNSLFITFISLQLHDGCL